MMLSSKKEFTKINVPAAPSGVLQWDASMTQGGIPRGGIVEIFGMESTGKSTLCWAIAKSFLDIGEEPIYIVDHGFDSVDWIKRLGNDLRTCIFQPENAELAFEYLLNAAQTADCIILDSVTALVPFAELDGAPHDYRVVPRMMSKAIRQLIPIIKNSDCIIVFTSQMRVNKLGYLQSTGGEALENAAALRVHLSESVLPWHTFDEDGYAGGINVKIDTIKNTTGTSEPVVVPLYFGETFQAGFERVKNENEFRQAHGLPIKQEK